MSDNRMIVVNEEHQDTIDWFMDWCETHGAMKFLADELGMSHQRIRQWRNQGFLPYHRIEAINNLIDSGRLDKFEPEQENAA